MYAGDPSVTTASNVKEIARCITCIWTEIVCDLQAANSP